MQPRPLPGDLLVAAAGSLDGVFDQAVVMLVDADEMGAFGVVLNRPLCASGCCAAGESCCAVDDVLPGWGDVVTGPPVLFQGGPVQTDGAVCLAIAREGERPLGFRPLRGRLGLLNLDTPLELVVGHYEGLRIFAGYSGWDAGQLDAELDEGYWYLLPGSVQDVLTGSPGRLWRDVLRRVRGDVALFSTWTATPELN